MAERLQREARVRQILDAVVSGQHTEDSLVELKTKLPDHQRAARRIAGLANAARGQEVLWLIGVDEKAGTVPGVKTYDHSSWWNQALSHFDDGVAPRVEEVVVPYNDVSVLAMFMDTTTAPYVVKLGDGGVVAREVPWRLATGTRSAQRGDLVQVLAPVTVLPNFEIVYGFATVSQDPKQGKQSDLYLHLVLRFYVTPRRSGSDPIVFPFHRTSPRLRLSPRRKIEPQLQLRQLGPTFGHQPSAIRSVTIASSDTEAVVYGPGMMVMNAGGQIPYLRIAPTVTARATLGLIPADSEIGVLLTADLPPVERREKEVGRWELGSP